MPVTVPYERFSIRGAHWFLARALKQLIDGAGIAKADVDGLCVASFTLNPDTAVGLTQHLGLSPRWLDHVPMGGASGIVSLRRAARAVQPATPKSLPALPATPITSTASASIPRASACSRRMRSFRMVGRT